MRWKTRSHAYTQTNLTVAIRSLFTVYEKSHWSAIHLDVCVQCKLQAHSRDFLLYKSTLTRCYHQFQAICALFSVNKMFSCKLIIIHIMLSICERQNKINAKNLKTSKFDHVIAITMISLSKYLFKGTQKKHTARAIAPRKSIAWIQV